MQNKNAPTGLSTEQIIDKLQEMLKPSGWHNLLKGFLVSDDFKEIIQTLQELVQDNKRFTPPLKQVFKAFQECPVDKLKVVVIGHEPYPQFGVADGMAFSCGNTMKLEPPLRYIHKAISDTVYKGQKDFKELSPDLTCWANQGVLLLNTSLTTEINKPGKHFPIWKEFTEYLIDMLNSTKEPLVWVFFGKTAEEYADLVDDKHFKLFVGDPVSSTEQNETHWNQSDVFNKVNTLLSELQKTFVSW